MEAAALAKLEPALARGCCLGGCSTGTKTGAEAGTVVDGAIRGIILFGAGAACAITGGRRLSTLVNQG